MTCSRWAPCGEGGKMDRGGKVYARVRLFMDDERRGSAEEDSHVREIPYINGR